MSQSFFRRLFPRLGTKTGEGWLSSGSDSLQLHLADGSTIAVTFRDIGAIHAFKRDELTTDMVWLRIEYNSSGSTAALEIHEELPGFEDLMLRLEALPDFDRTWRQKALLPAFRTEWTKIYDRDNGPGLSEPA